jgi:metallophosphoesterase (TIGR00282 family)
MLGDVVGEPGLTILEKRLPSLITEYNADFTVVNGENALGGFGLSAETLDRILAAGADVVTGGNHIWEKREFWPVMDSGKPVLRPANYPGGGNRAVPGRRPLNTCGTAPAQWEIPSAVPGRGTVRLEKNGLSVLIVNLQGREMMTPIDCPFHCFDAIATEEAGVIIVDFHAESPEEKEALAYYLDGRAGIVAGTHTHVQTADERILPGGTAYITDLGMTGAMNGVLGMDKDICISRARSQVAYRMECTWPLRKEDYAIQGIVVELDGKGRASGIKRISR